MQHIEEAGIHSGDSACTLPVVSVDKEILAQIKRETKDIALEAWCKSGLLNIQYAIYQNEIHLIASKSQS